MVGSVGPSVVALAAIGVSVWTTRRTLDEARDDSFWLRRTEVYVDLVRRVLKERSVDLEETLITISTLDAEPSVYWQSTRDRDPTGWQEREVQIVAYSSDRMRQLYGDWDGALLRLSGVIQPAHVTGTARADDPVSAVRVAIADVAATSDELLAQLRAELQAGHTLRTSRTRSIWRLIARS